MGGGKALSKFSSSKDQVSGAKFTSASGATIIEYTRSLAAGDGVAIINGENSFLWAYGNGALGYHSSRGGFKLNFATCSSATIVLDDTKITTHGWLMTMAWGVFIPTGVLQARYGKTLFGTKWWIWHGGIQVSALVLTAAGFAMAVRGVSDIK